MLGLARIPEISQPQKKGNTEENRINSWVGRREIGREGGRERQRERQRMKETGREKKKKRDREILVILVILVL